MAEISHGCDEPDAGRSMFKQCLFYDHELHAPDPVYQADSEIFSWPMTD